jgi:hypothetical protein
MRLFPAQPPPNRLQISARSCDAHNNTDAYGGEAESQAIRVSRPPYPYMLYVRPVSERQLQDLGFIPVPRLSARLPIFFSIVSRLRNSFGLASAMTFAISPAWPQVCGSRYRRVPSPQFPHRDISPIKIEGDNDLVRHGVQTGAIDVCCTIISVSPYVNSSSMIFTGGLPIRQRYALGPWSSNISSRT